MYNLEKQLEIGGKIMKQNEQRDLRVVDIMAANDLSGGDKYELATNMFLIGVAIGHRIAEAKRAKGAK